MLFLITGTCYAAHNNEIFQAPNGLHAMGYNSFVDEKGHNIDILNYSDTNYNKWFNNDTNYAVEPYSGNNSFYLGTDDSNDCYLIEVIQKDGAKYIIHSWSPNGAGESAKLFSNLQEFNKVNKVTPMEV